MTINAVPDYTGQPALRSDGPLVFPQNAEDQYNYLAIFSLDWNVSIAQMNVDIAQTNQNVIDCAASAEAAASSANFIGLWSTNPDGTPRVGALNTPASVFNDNTYWQLVNNLADVTLSEPSSANADWRVSYSELNGISRGLNEVDEVVQYTTYTGVLDAVKYLYDAVEQVTWGVPTLDSAGKTIVSVSGSTLTTTGGTGGNTYTLVDIASFMSGKTAYLVFGTNSDLISGISAAGVPVDFGYLSEIKALVSTRWAGNVDKDDGANYTILTAAEYGGVPDGSQDFYVGGGVLYVAQMEKRAMARLHVGTNAYDLRVGPRDAVLISRSLTEETNAHGFADNTIIDTPTDAGQYGVFDATVKVRGAHAQGHLFAFQNRTDYEGSNSINEWAGYINWPVHSGTGNCVNCYGSWYKSAFIENGGTIDTQIGMYMEDLSGATSNTAVLLNQSSGYTIYAPNSGKHVLGGEVTVGTTNEIPGVALAFFSSNQSGFLSTNSLGATFGTEGDTQHQFVTDGATRFVMTTAYFAPSGDGGTDLGLAAKRWREVFSANGVINTSDGRLKTAVTPLDERETNAGIAIGKKIGKYKWLESVEKNGPSARIHIGLTVQEAIEVMKANDLDPFAYSFICYDKFNSAKEVKDSAGNTIQKSAAAGDVYSFRYNELSLFIQAAIINRLM